jgi:hypothetical protein
MPSLGWGYNMDKIDAVLLATDDEYEGTCTIALIVSAKEWDAFNAADGASLVVGKGGEE